MLCSVFRCQSNICSGLSTPWLHPVVYHFATAHHCIPLKHSHCMILQEHSTAAQPHVSLYRIQCRGYRGTSDYSNPKASKSLFSALTSVQACFLGETSCMQDSNSCSKHLLNMTEAVKGLSLAYEEQRWAQSANGQNIKFMRAVWAVGLLIQTRLA